MTDHPRPAGAEQPTCAYKRSYDALCGQREGSEFHHCFVTPHKDTDGCHRFVPAPPAQTQADVIRKVHDALCDCKQDCIVYEAARMLRDYLLPLAPPPAQTPEERCGWCGRDRSNSLHDHAPERCGLITPSGRLHDPVTFCHPFQPPASPGSAEEVIMPGDEVEHYGKVGAVVLTGGERYYMCIDARGAVSFMPAADVRRKDSVFVRKEKP